MSSPTSRKTVLSPTVTPKSFSLGLKHPTPSDQLHAPSQSPGIQSKGRGAVLGHASGSRAVKRKGSPPSVSENLTPAKRRPEPSTTLERDTSPQAMECGQWLNSTRGPGRERGRQSHESRGSNIPRGRKAKAAHSIDEIDDLSSPEASRASRGQGQATKRYRMGWHVQKEKKKESICVWLTYMFDTTNPS